MPYCKGFCGVVLLLGLSGCVTTYVSPGSDQPRAKINVVNAGYPTTVQVHGETQKCKGSNLALSLDRDTRGEFYLPAGKETALSLMVSGSSGNMLSFNCHTVFSFTPKANHVYKLKALSNTKRCGYEIQDTNGEPVAATRRIPNDAWIPDMAGWCK